MVKIFLEIKEFSTKKVNFPYRKILIQVQLSKPKYFQKPFLLLLDLSNNLLSNLKKKYKSDLLQRVKQVQFSFLLPVRELFLKDNLRFHPKQEQFFVFGIP